MSEQLNLVQKLAKIRAISDVVSKELVVFIILFISNIFSMT